MAPQRYERVPIQDDENSPVVSQRSYPIPSSPPPSFRSRASSPTSASAQRLLSDDPLATEAERTLADTFDSPSDDESFDGDEDGLDDRQRLMRGNPTNACDETSVATREANKEGVQRTVTELPVFTPQPTSGRVYGGGQNDGVFANLSAKPQRGEDVEEKPPSYEQAAADAAPPYWETTILAPGMVSDEVFIDGLPVGSVFSFVWNGLLSMSFQSVGVSLTSLLHTTHAAKNGSRAGLGITLINYGFSVKAASPIPSGPSGGSGDFSGVPSDPNSHDANPNSPGSDVSGSNGAFAVSFTANDWLAYILMIMGWFILIKSISDFIRARRHEQLVLQSPDRGLGVPVVAEGERPEQSV